MSKIRINTTWASMDGPDGAWLVSAYDDATFEEHGEVPPWHRAAVQAAERVSGDVVIRSLVIEVEYDDVAVVFEEPTIEGTVAT